MEAVNWNWTHSMRWEAMHCYDQLDISKTCEDITIATSRQGLSTWETWCFTEFKMKRAYTNSTRDAKDLSSSLKSQDQDPTDWSTRTDYKSPALGTSSISRSSIHKLSKTTSRISNFNKETWSFRSSIQMPKTASGVVTPSATSNTNLSLFTQSQRHGESSSRG